MSSFEPQTGSHDGQRTSEVVGDCRRGRHGVRREVGGEKPTAGEPTLGGVTHEPGVPRGAIQCSRRFGDPSGRLGRLIDGVPQDRCDPAGCQREERLGRRELLATLVHMKRIQEDEVARSSRLADATESVCNIHLCRPAPRGETVHQVGRTRSHEFKRDDLCASRQEGISEGDGSGVPPRALPFPGDISDDQGVRRRDERVEVGAELDKVPDAARPWLEVSKVVIEAAAMTLQIARRLLACEDLAEHGVLDDIAEVGGVRVGHRPG